jgi:glutaminyl-tRNA synthetase
MDNKEGKNFIEEIIEEGNVKDIVTRFPPEPSGNSLHLGHAKSIFLNFGLAEKYNGKCNLRFDDTNPSTESMEFVESMKKDIEWLGVKPANIYYASNYFDKIYNFALELINKGKAYVCTLNSEEIKEYMGTTDSPGKPSPNRDLSVEENLSLFESMRNGDVEDGKMTLRAKIDMSSSNVHMRDPIIYRVKKEHHHNTGDKWCIYPMYDFAHCLSDAIENITHSVCTLEFEPHRPLYDWIINELIDRDIKPRQIEFSRLNLSHTVMSKRIIKQLVEEGIVDGWDDPRLPTLSGLRRRGIPVKAIKLFCEKIGISRRESLIDSSLFESCIKEVLNKDANRRMTVFDPLKVTITNWEGGEEMLPAKLNPESEEENYRMVNFGKHLYIERGDFMENAPKKFFRLSNNKEVRFKYGYYVTCNEVVKDNDGKIIELLCTYDPETRGGWSDDGRKIKGTLHWVNADNNIPINVNVYDRLFSVEEPTEDFLNEFNKESKQEVKAFTEISTSEEKEGYTVQFERNGYYNKESKGVWNMVLPLKDSWRKKK